jgi:hypothetical protein
MMNTRISPLHLLIAACVVAAICTSTAIFAPAAADKANLLAKAAPGDWAEYAVTRQNETVPLLGFNDQKHWRTIRVVEEASVLIDEYFMVGDQRTSGLGRPVKLDKSYEPIAGLADNATITVISESPETLTVAGKSYACTKIERKISQPIDEEKFQPKWEGTSTIWICPDVPVGGLVKMVNSYVDQLAASAEENKIVETWVLTGFGFKNWEE